MKKYISICDRCKLLRYEEQQVSCSYAHWFGDDGYTPPDSVESDPWVDCENFTAKEKPMKEQEIVDRIKNAICDWCPTSNKCDLLNGCCHNESSAHKILSLINETHIPLDKEVKIVCEHWRTDACKGCKYGDVITPTDIHCRVNGVITRTVGELVEGKNGKS